MDSLFFHPKIVHLPMALSVLMPLIAFGIAVAWWRKWLPARGWVLAVALQGALVASGMAALQSGEADEDRVERVVSEHLIEEHEEAAEVFVAVSGVVLGVMLLALLTARLPIGLPLALVASLGTLVVVGLGYRTGDAGGALVYRHGAASAYLESSAPAARARPRADHHHEDDDD